ncbi:MAG: Phosphate acyltransferase [Chlamydiales bacterium]|nr:Phosphate acyltransferase [Chlamydiales bacterium]
MNLRVGVDLMGGDQSPESIFEAVLSVANRTDVRFVVLATHAYFSILSDQAHPHIEFVTTEEFIEMDESPLLAVRRKKNSSMAAGMRLLRENKLDAFLSTGSTGALVATATLHLDPLEGVERPALLVTMPTAKGEVVVLDVGANIQPKPEHLVAYAQLGVLFSALYRGVKKPSIGLLNIGAEEQKGTKELKEAYASLQEVFQKRFLGNVEGRTVFRGDVDVLVTDGFTGNVFLKTSEGISRFLAEYLTQHFEIPDIIAHLNQRFNYAEHPGAFLCGVDGLVVKCHGDSDQQALMNGIYGAIDLAQSQLLAKMKRHQRRAL